MAKFIIFLGVFLALALPLKAAELRVAVASNFKSTAQKIVTKFEQQSPHTVTLISGSSGGLFNAIYQGAPYDIFLSADDLRPQKLVKQRLAFADSLFTYAIGQLAFWMPNNENLSLNNLKTTITAQQGKLAIANPRLAPYGHSASKFIKKNNLSNVVKPKLVKGNNVTQALQFIRSGNAQSGFVSLSELLHAGIKQHFILLEPQSYPSINQQAVILHRTKNYDAAKHFFSFIKNQASDTISRSGYLLKHPQSTVEK